MKENQEKVVMNDSNRLNILWTSGDAHTARLMVFMYAKNSILRGWWDEVTVIIWGASAKLASEDDLIREEIKIAQNVGVKFSACVACARGLGVVENLEAMGVEVVSWGPLLTDILQNKENLITV